MSTDLYSQIPQIVAWLLTSSGWAYLLYGWYTSKPKIRGQIFNVITGIMQNPNPPPPTLTVFNVYLYLTNVRRNAIHIQEYELEIDTGSGYEKMERVWGAQAIPRWTFTSPTHLIEIPDYPDKLITSKAKPVEYGKPLHGFVLFASRKPMEDFKDKVISYRVTCVDAFRDRHEIVSYPKQFVNVHLLEEMAGIRLVPKEGANK